MPEREPEGKPFQGNGAGHVGSHAGRAVMLVAIVSLVTWAGSVAVGAGAAILSRLLSSHQDSLETAVTAVQWAPVGAVLGAWAGTWTGLWLTGRRGPRGRLRMAPWWAPWPGWCSWRWWQWSSEPKTPWAESCWGR